MHEIERAVRGEELVVAACHFVAETIEMKVEAVAVFLTARFEVRAKGIAREASIELEQARQILHLADRCAMAYRRNWSATLAQSLVIITLSSTCLP